MREIKFRAWDKKKLKMISWTNIRWNDNPHFHDDKDFELMQYTGLKDKYGKEIYEGDVVKEGNSEGKIDYIEDGFYISWVINRDFWSDTLKHHAKELEVIGNIYEVNNGQN